MKLMVLGMARHGKDTVCEILRDSFGLTFQSSSEFVAERAVRPWLAERGFVYPDYATMYADRVNHRSDWFDAIKAFNTPDLARLGKELYQKFDIYCGIRNRDELIELKRQRAMQWTFWVDASRRLPPESSSSCTVTAADADSIIDNNGTLDDLVHTVIREYRDATWAVAALGRA